MKALLCAFFLCFIASALAQDHGDTGDSALQVYSDLLNGKRSPKSLTAEERQQVLAIHGMLARSCSRLEGQCRAVCEAANDLEDAANDLAQCARKHDFGDDCGRSFREVRDASDDYESAVSEASGKCD